ncbi:DNA polymerase beta domain protein region [Rivularia sp. IAM M-261]|nr:DNA polymerase beta domain protein region [Calothrix sp. PCC 7716]GJD15345.1 DNA polymerase beta domain protein region [Rivularia sp. IAM M-261]
METITIEKLRELAQQLPGKIPYLKMLVLFGSRATGNTHKNSDWDFAVLYEKEQRNALIENDVMKLFALPMLLDDIFGINADMIDVVELNHCSWLIAHFIARDGILIFEKDLHGFEYFRLTSLRPESELKKYREDQHRLIEMDLKKWKV